MRRRDEGDFEKIIFNMWFVGNGGMSKTSKTQNLPPCFRKVYKDDHFFFNQNSCTSPTRLRQAAWVYLMGPWSPLDIFSQLS